MYMYSTNQWLKLKQPIVILLLCWYSWNVSLHVRTHCVHECECFHVCVSGRSTQSSSAMTWDSTAGLTHRGERGCCWRWRATSTSLTWSTCCWEYPSRSALQRTAPWSLSSLSTSIHLEGATQRAGTSLSMRTVIQTGRPPSWTYPSSAITGLWRWATSGRRSLKLFISTFGAG